MIFDLHAHYPMHLKETTGRFDPPVEPDDLGDLIRRIVLELANRLANFPGGGKPAVTIANLADSRVRVILSPLVLPFDEMDLGKAYNAPPDSRYFDDLLLLLDAVDRDVLAHGGVVARNRQQLDQALTGPAPVVIHAVEGGFHVGASADEIQRNIATLAARGVACITVAHLFFRQVATNAPAIPFMEDGMYNVIFHQDPSETLTGLGEALIRAMVEHRILIDITHMTRRAIDATIALLDRIDAERNDGTVTPLLATHAACAFGPSEYNLSDRHIEAIGRRRGLIGLILSTHWMADGLPAPRTLDESLALIERHIRNIHGRIGSHECTAIGTDLDGFIKPALPGFNLPRDLDSLAEALRLRFPADAERICSGNALRVLRTHWR